MSWWALFAPSLTVVAEERALSESCARALDPPLVHTRVDRFLCFLRGGGGLGVSERILCLCFSIPAPLLWRQRTYPELCL